MFSFLCGLGGIFTFFSALFQFVFRHENVGAFNIQVTLTILLWASALPISSALGVEAQENKRRVKSSRQRAGREINRLHGE